VKLGGTVPQADAVGLLELGHHQEDGAVGLAIQGQRGVDHVDQRLHVLCRIRPRVFHVAQARDVEGRTIIRGRTFDQHRVFLPKRMAHAKFVEHVGVVHRDVADDDGSAQDELKHILMDRARALDHGCRPSN
jgi:hypothetical protein